MYKLLFFLALALFIDTGLFAQSVSYDPDRWCTGWHNPNNFTYTSGDANTQWQGLTGSKASTASSCTSGISLVNNNPTVVSASNLTTISSGSSCYNQTSTDVSGSNDYMNRFVIKGSGTDGATGIVIQTFVKE